jgi:hypothetical protein
MAETLRIMGMFLDRHVPPTRALALIAALCVFEYASHLHINGEVVAFGPYELSWSGANGIINIVNGRPVHFEGIGNLRNAWFFAGADTPIDLSYTIPTGRLFLPFMAAQFNHITSDVILSTWALNLVLWVLASWAAWDIGRRDLGSPLIGLALGILVATNQGFVSNALDTKVHLASWAFIIFSLWFAERLRIFHPGTPWSNYHAMGWIAGLGMLINGTHTMILGYIALRGVLVVQWRKLAWVAVVPVVLTIAFALLYRFAAARGVPVGNMQAVVAGNLVEHLRVAASHLIQGTPVEIVIASPTGMFTYSGLLEPFRWMLLDWQSFFLMPGYLVLGLCIVGFAYPRRGALAMALPSAAAVVIVVSLIVTYWPWAYFYGYFYYFAIISFMIMAAVGIENVAAGIVLAGRRFGRARWFAAAATVFALLGGQVVHTNQDILFGHLIEHVRLHRSFDVPYPGTWDFRVIDW